MDEVLRRAGLFQGVDPADVEALGSQFEIFDAPRGTTLFNEGEPGDSLYIVLSGKVKLGRKSSDGRENLVDGALELLGGCRCPALLGERKDEEDREGQCP